MMTGQITCNVRTNRHDTTDEIIIKTKFHTKELDMKKIARTILTEGSTLKLRIKVRHKYITMIQKIRAMRIGLPFHALCLDKRKAGGLNIKLKI